jgi:hypothetical protein
MLQLRKSQTISYQDQQATKQAETMNMVFRRLR